MQVTIKKIAEYAGVSRGTVDRALNNREGINPDVSKRIRKIASELGYSPNRAGKALASRKNPVQIGVLLNSLGNPFYDDVIKGIYEAKQEYRDFSVKVHLRQIKGYNVDEQLDEIDKLLVLGVTAIVFTPINDSRIADRIKKLVADGKIVVKLNSDVCSTKGTFYIGCDYEKSGATAAGLLGLFTGGAAKIGIVTGSAKMLGHTQRTNGFMSVCKKSFPQMEICEIYECNDDDEQAYAAAKNLLSQQITAIYFSAGGVGGGVKAIDEFCHANKNSIRPITICCDATEKIRGFLLQDKITATVCQQPFKQGYECIRMIFNRFLTGEFDMGEQMLMENEVKIKYNI